MKRIALFLLLASPLRAQTAPVHSNTLVWQASAAVGATYNVYRAPTSCSGTFVKLNTAPVTALTFVDSGMTDGAVNCYYVTAVSSLGVESSPSGKVLATTPTIVPAPPVTPPPGTVTNQAQ